MCRRSVGRWTCAWTTVLIVAMLSLALPPRAIGAWSPERDSPSTAAFGMARGADGVVAPGRVVAAGEANHLDRSLLPPDGWSDPAEYAATPAWLPVPPGGTKELPQRRTRTSRTFQTQQGNYLAQVFPNAIHFQDAQGHWQPIDNTLTTDQGNGAHQNRANRYTAKLPNTLAAPVRVTLGHAWVEFSLDGAAASASASVSSDTKTYANAFPGVTVALQTGNDQVKETLSLASPSATPSFAYTVHASPGLTAKAEADGSIAFRDGQGVAQFSFPAPFMTDSATPAPAYSTAITQSLTAATGGNGWTVSLSADAAWLNDPARHYPVVIDPTVYLQGENTGAGNNLDCYLRSGSGANTSYCPNTTLQIGVSGSETRRTLFRFDVAGVVPSQSNVLFSEVGAYLQSSTGSSATTVNLHTLSRSWTSGATWNKYDGTHSWTTAGGDYTSAVVYSNPHAGPSADWLAWDVTALAQGWVVGTTTNNGVLLKQATETGSTLLTFTSFNSTDTAHWPYLKVTYEPWIGVQPFYGYFQQRLTDRTQLAVNVADGNLLLTGNDVQIKGTGLDLSLNRYYNARAAGSGAFGLNSLLSAGPDVQLSIFTSGSAAYYGPSGFQILFTQNLDGSFTAPAGINATLVKNGDGTYTLTFNRTGSKLNFTSAGRLTNQQDKNGNTVSYSYNGNGTLASIADTQARTITVSYTASNLISQLADGTGRLWKYAYDGSGNLTGYTDPLSKTTQLTYNPYNGLVASVVDPNGNTTQFTYDAQNRVTDLFFVTNPGTGAGDEYIITYNSGNTVVKDPNLHNTTYYYDALGRVTQTKDHLNNTFAASYTANNDVQQLTDALSKVTSYTWDTSKNNLTAGQIPTGAAQALQYNDGTHPYFPTKLTDEQGNLWNLIYDSRGNVITKTNSLSSQNTVSYSYNTNGTAASMTDALGHTTTYGYDAHGNRTSTTYPSPLGATAATYDGLSRTATTTDGKGQVTQYAYDKLDRTTAITYTGGLTITFAYDGAGNRTSMVDNTGTTTYSYDARNRLHQKTLPGGSTITYTYDGVGNLLWKDDAGGTLAYTYNAVNLLTGLAEPSGSCSAPVSLCTTFTYDANHRLTATTYPSGVLLTRAYDTSGRLLSIVGKTSGGTILTSSTYTYSICSGGSEQ